jgi:hypothetical protein
MIVLVVATLVIGCPLNERLPVFSFTRTNDVANAGIVPST